MTGTGPGNAQFDLGPHVFVDDVAEPVLSPDDYHHLARVLRVRRGDRITVSDGRGHWRECRFIDDESSGVEVSGDVVSLDPPSPRLTVGFALVKGDRPELVVQKLTELGIDRIIPFVAERSVVRWDDARVAKNEIRHRKVAREAAMQSRRAYLPEILPVAGFGELIRAEAGTIGLAQRGGHPPSLLCTTVLIGPEGGWSDGELASGVATIAFGDQVLRTETAAITAAGVLAALRSGLVAVND